MFIYKISGYTYPIKDKIKALRVDNKHFWKFSDEDKNWSLEIPDHLNTTEFQEKLERLSRSNNLGLTKTHYIKKNTIILSSIRKKKNNSKPYVEQAQKK